MHNATSILGYLVTEVPGLVSRWSPEQHQYCYIRRTPPQEAGPATASRLYSTRVLPDAATVNAERFIISHDL
ncbi:hypothetical protein N0V93_006247 [Gnomoniopsis smithogilvyi]|uniref:Uncharacterized protein n=1 Tax=Gnomoniopsis smithogilvyi TaxID=1191159 RepID=A0A9W8YPB8_9PEZI|nr:hypothetical protein N0V93_006247 [Gnomoniopsis smithogilvyi]